MSPRSTLPQFKRGKFQRPQIAVLRTLAKRSGGRPVSLKGSWRGFVVPLWRRGLVEIWYRLVPFEQPSNQGPYYALSVGGLRVASSFLARSLSARERRAKSSGDRPLPGDASEFIKHEGTTR